jgi:hypothetical protein
LYGHVPRRSSAGQEMSRCAGQYRAHEVLARHLDERNQLDVTDRDGVEGDVDAPGLMDYLAEVSLDGLLV